LHCHDRVSVALGLGVSHMLAPRVYNRSSTLPNTEPKEVVPMKRMMAFAALTTLLAGCTSAVTLRSSKPTAVYEGEGSAEDIATCVNAAWSTKPVKLSMNVLYSGTTIEIRQTDDGPIVALVDIKPVGPRTIATYYSQFPSDDTWYFNQIEDCTTSVRPRD
jgi:uncharacterized protein YceK